MSTTQIQDSNGNLLWSPVDPNGKYSLKKFESVAEILESLINSIEIKAQISMDEDQLANVYTKTQADQRFVLVSNFDTLISSEIRSLIAQGVIVGLTDMNLANSRLLTLFKSCYGTNFEGEKVVSNSFNERIENLTVSYNSMYSDLSRAMRDLYFENPDGTLDRSRLLYAAVSDAGTTSELSAAFSGVNRSKLVNAINYSQSLIDNKNEIIGSGTLQTASNNLIGAVNELLGLNNESSRTIVTISSSIATVSSNVASLTESISDIKVSYNQINSRVAAIETLDGTGTLNTVDKTLIGGINEIKSSIEAVSSDVVDINTDLRQAKSDITSLKGKTSEIGILSDLDPTVLDDTLVKSINKVVDLISGLDSRLSGIESSIEDMSSRLGNVESGIESLTSSVESMESRIASVEFSITSIEDRVTALENAE